jgi:hypothetical protein
MGCDSWTAFGLGGRVGVGGLVGVMVAVPVIVGLGVTGRGGFGVNGGSAHSSPRHPHAIANGLLPTGILVTSTSAPRSTTETVLSARFATYAVPP